MKCRIIQACGIAEWVCMVTVSQIEDLDRTSRFFIRAHKPIEIRAATLPGFLRSDGKNKG